MGSPDLAVRPSPFRVLCCPRGWIVSQPRIELKDSLARQLVIQISRYRMLSTYQLQKWPSCLIVCKSRKVQRRCPAIIRPCQYLLFFCFLPCSALVVTQSSCSAELL